jgi:riboflavin kinase/FMN adenylyltransferase
MRLLRVNIGSTKLTQPLTATIGNFDGVHLGHQAIIQNVVEHAQATKTASALITFEPTPSEYFLKSHAPARLTRLSEKLMRLKNLGLDYVLVLPFKQNLANLPAIEFVEFLHNSLQVQHLWVGDDFRFGKNRVGDINLLQDFATQHDFQINQLTSYIIEGERVSSSRIRQLLAAGDLAQAALLLGRAYTMSGRVAHGQARGRTIGFPTANILLKRHLSPLLGVYAVRVHGLSSKSMNGVANLGNRPTVDGIRYLLEVHLFDFDSDIYGQHIEVEFCHKLRDEQRFTSFAELQQQIQLDARAARLYFKMDLAT